MSDSAMTPDTQRIADATRCNNEFEDDGSVCNAELVLLNDEEGQFCPLCCARDRIASLLAENARLREDMRSAFGEGCRAGWSMCSSRVDIFHDTEAIIAAWDLSASKARLDAALDGASPR